MPIARELPTFTRVDATGHKVRLSKYKGKVRAARFWGNMVHRLQRGDPLVRGVCGKYRKSGLAVVGVSMDDEGWKVVKPFLAEKMKINLSGRNWR